MALLHPIILNRLKTTIQNLSPQFKPFPTHPHRIIPQLRPERLLYHQNRFERLHVHVAEEPLKPPPYTLPCHPKRLVNLLAIGAPEDDMAGPTRLQFHPQVFRLHQFLQIFQECLVLFG